jgi:prepilin-type N-terminal cleavage/methylation domain-containing protein
MKYLSSETKRGFTFVEVLVAVAILTILSAIAMTSYQDVRKKSRDTERVSDIAQLQLALRLYKDAHSAYPSYPNGITIGEGGTLDTELGTYLSGTVNDPMGSVSETAYEYVYDSDFTCGGTSKKVLYAKTMERDTSTNWATVCGGTLPGTNTYGVILQ